MADPGEPRDRSPRPAIDIPDLEPPPPRPSQSGLRAVRVEASAPALRTSSPALAAPFDEDDVGSPGPNLDLDLHARISSGHRLVHGGKSLSADDFDLEPVRPLLDHPSVGLALDDPWPSGVTPDRARILVDRGAARELARFGKPPSGVLFTPFYALRVARRQRALMAVLRKLDQELERVIAERDALLAELVERLRPELERSPAFRKLLEPLAALAAQTEQRASTRATDFDAARAHRALLADVGRAVLKARGDIAVDAPTLVALHAADAAVLSSIQASELHLAALDTCDASKVQNGWIVLTLALFCLTAVVAWQLVGT